MKRGACLLIGIIFVGLLLGCGSESESEKAGKEQDKIEKIGSAASAIGYDGKKIEGQLRELEDVKKAQDEELEKVMEE